MNSKDFFFREIKEYYLKKADNYSDEFIDGLSQVVTDYIYNWYSESFKEKPKSRKRYSTLKLSDLEHPFIHDKIISFAKKNVVGYGDYVKFCSTIFGLTNEEFLKYEKRRQQFHNMF
jgi:protein-disulfide isomerase